jgi:ABC-type microcin C transport system duplicated ATPase subunit YejF
MSGAEFKTKSVQADFQDRYTSLSPRVRGGEILSEPIVVHNTVPKAEIKERVQSCCRT